ncbi:MAG: DUF87 domain-containing protein [Candidatus Freyarchaeota archaeon]|nr:DUF87 domain-containing protein [Candidatus Jordarchaeia archaeon]
MIYIRTGKYAERCVILGKTGSGKTYFCREFLARLNVPRIIVYDIEWEYDCLQPCFVENELYRIKNYLYQPRFRLIFQPQTDSIEVFEEVCGLIYSNYDILFVAEEIDTWEKSKGNLTPQFANLIKRGRKRGISVISISQRPAECHKTVIANAEHWFLFKLTYKGDLDWLEENRIPKEICDKLPFLPPYYFIHFDGERAELHAPFPNRLVGEE